MVFDPGLFRRLPDVMVVTPEAAKIIDRLAIRGHFDQAQVLAAIFAVHLEIQLPGLAGLDVATSGGCLISALPDDLSVVDVYIASKKDRRFLICTQEQATRASMDIEDMMNHLGAEILHLGDR